MQQNLTHFSEIIKDTTDITQIRKLAEQFVSQFKGTNARYSIIAFCNSANREFDPLSKSKRPPEIFTNKFGTFAESWHYSDTNQCMYHVFEAHSFDDFQNAVLGNLIDNMLATSDKLRKFVTNQISFHIKPK